jgi:uncharacterized protein (DUF3820 family)
MATTLTATERKLIILALDRAASAHEAEIAAAKFIKSLRTRGVSGYEFPDLLLADRRQNNLARGATIITFGRYRGESISDVPESYLRWVITNVKTEPRLVRLITEFLEDQN